ncbi:hypothetical protein FAI41_07205 [Acetobacteraceae bacterium]|nr:hypothetical protein FAI41_07205 [Acetobacteraceae bacterium]
MDLVGFAHKVDDALIDRVFQPVLDLLWAGKSPWRLGLNFQLGSLVFLGFSLFIPILKGQGSLGFNLSQAVGLAAGIILFLGFSRMHIVERAGMGNPMRPALFSYRLLVLAFSFYDIFSMMREYGPLALPKDLASLSDIVFTIGLYVMACRTAPPRNRKQVTSYAWQQNF